VTRYFITTGLSTAHVRDRLRNSKSICTAFAPDAERIAAAMNALDGIDLSTLRGGWLADLIERANIHTLAQNAPGCLVEAIREAREANNG
jgi:hypothetical protein